MIVDANIATYWFVESPLSSVARTLLVRQDLIAPNLVRWEVARAMQKYVRAGQVSPSQAKLAVDRIAVYIGVFIDGEDLFEASWRIALRESHIVYDCLYVALALERRESLATADRRLAALARKLGIETMLVEPA
jgi:predicted nucleic acid-binding protein